MFDTLVESGSHADDLARKGSFFLGTMVVYGATLFVMFFLGAIPWALGLIVVVPVAVISTFVSYREVFEATPP